MIDLYNEPLTGGRIGSVTAPTQWDVGNHIGVTAGAVTRPKASEKMVSDSILSQKLRQRVNPV